MNPFAQLDDDALITMAGQFTAHLATKSRKVRGAFGPIPDRQFQIALDTELIRRGIWGAR